MKKSYIAIGVIILVLLALGCSGSDSGSDNTQSSGAAEQTAQVNTQSNQTQDQTQDKNEEQTTQEQSEPVVIASWEGESTKNTETFTVPSDEWKISWDTQSGQYGDMNFQIYVYDKNGAMKGVAANVIGANTDSTIMRGAGDYYLMINTAQPYKITVETV